MAAGSGKTLLRNGFTTLAENKVRLLASVPGSPVRKTLPVRISEFGKVRPVGLYDLRKLAVCRSERQPTERVSLKRAEDVRKFQRVQKNLSSLLGHARTDPATKWYRHLVGKSWNTLSRCFEKCFLGDKATTCSGRTTGTRKEPTRTVIGGASELCPSD